MSTSTQQTDLAQFQAVTGLPEADCRQRLQSFNWNVATALDAYFNSNAASPTVFTPPTVSQTPLVPVVAHPPAVPVIVKDDDDDALLCGLFPKNGRMAASIPLRGLSVKAEVVGMVAQVEVSQRYFNADSAPIEAVFKFKQEECSIYGFEAIVDGEKVVGEIKEKEEAMNAYDDAISSGGRGFLLSQDDKVKGAFSLSVGNLPPGKECVITFRYVSELAVEGDFVRVILPITRLPIHGGDASTSTTDEDTAFVKDGLHVVITADMPAPVHAVECPSGHELASTTTGNTARIQFDSAKHASSTGLVVLLGQRESLGQPQAVVELDRAAGTAVAMVSFVPQLDELRDADVIAEVIFVVDRSGSMSGSRINQAKNAMALFLHSLPIGTRFNVIGFGSRFVKLFPMSKVYDDETLERANQHVSSISADLGGTELLEPLADVLKRPADPQYPRQVFVLTDGEVDNTDAVIECVRKHAKGTRVFTLGIGSDASTELVKGIAKAGKGHAEFVVSGERLEAKVLRQLKRALQPVLKQPVIEYAAADGIAVKAHTPNPLPAVFEGERVIAYAFFDTTDTALIESALSGAVLKAKTDVEDSENVEYKITAQSNIKEGQLIHRLAARSRIRDLEEANAEANKSTITELALRYGLVSPFTSFVASVDSDEAAMETMRRVDVGDRLTSSIAARSPSPVQSIDHQLDQVNQIMRMNIESVLQRGECLDHIVEQTEELRECSHTFRRNAKKSSGFLSSIGSAISSLVGFGSGSSAPAQKTSTAVHQSLNDPLAEELDINECMANDDDDEDSESDGDALYGGEEEKEEEKESKNRSSRSRSSEILASDCAPTSDLFGDFAPPAAQADPFFALQQQQAQLPIMPAPAPVFGYAAAPASSSLGLNRGPSSRMSSPPSAAAHMRPLDRFVHHQKANGSWELNENLAQALGRQLAALVASVPAGVSAEVWATALALVALDSQFAAEKEEWELLAGKAKRWLSRELKGAAQVTVDSLLSDASAFLSA